MSNATYALGAAGLLIGATAPNDRISIPDDCAIVRVGQDGRETRTMAKSSKGTGTASARSSSSSSSSSVSASSSSRGGGSARATSSVTDGNGRTITTNHDERGCTVTIDER